jgi:ABC-type uncharacterized transport system fused permease/ATPase subunit
MSKPNTVRMPAKPHKTTANSSEVNIDQRIQQDAQDFIASTIEFVRGMVNSVVTSLEFAVVLWGLAGILTDTLVDVVRRVVAHLQAVVVFVGKPA